MRCHPGWLLDLYPAPAGMALWMLGRDGSRRCFFDKNFRPALYVHGPLGNLRLLARTLPRRFAGLHAEFADKLDLWSREQVRVLAVTPSSPAAFPIVVKCIRQDAPETDLYNADLLPEQVYCYDRQVFPLAYCELEAGGPEGDELRAIRCLDDPCATEYELPPLRVLEMRPECETGNPNHGGRFNVVVKIEGAAWVFNEAESGEPLAQSLAEALHRYDPDLILSEWGDSYLLPRLLRQAAALKISLPLNRDPRREPFRKRERSYFSYGRIVFKNSATCLFGRLHVDLRNSFVCGESGLDGLYELARLTKLPVQYCARTTTGTGITSMQLDLAYREGILIPSQKAQPERAKSGLELIVADRGGLVFHPKPGLHENVAELDFASMFPSIMARFNVSPDTINCGCCQNALVPELGYSICQRWPGIVSRTVGPIIEKREQYKALIKSSPDRFRRAVYDARKTALKWMLVTCFGYQGFKNARFGRIEAHEAINCFGRDRLLMAKDLAESQGYEVLHALVDSLYLWKRGTTMADYQKLAREIAAATGLPMDVEGVYRWIVFVPSKTSPRIGVPNRFFGVMQNGKLKVRGIEMRRHDCVPLAARMQEEILAALAQAAGRTEYMRLLETRVAPILDSYVTRVRDGDVTAADLTISKRLTQYPEQYAHATHNAIAAQSLQARGVRLRPGETVEYVVADAGAKVPCERVRPLALLGENLLYDRNEYERFLREAFQVFVPQ